MLARILDDVRRDLLKEERRSLSELRDLLDRLDAPAEDQEALARSIAQLDELFAALLESPFMAQLRRIDLTENITNVGAQLLSEHLESLEHVEELWIGSSDRRRSVERMNPGTVYPPGTLEIDDAWRSRLRARLGKRLRFEPRPNHPDL